ncbi:PepSY domain-containing protein [Roseivirga sp.]|uniref:PepSY domain-containing protein n=1 Tax=Roseivirga sp. TaxID=1964215 RepID=UPI003B8DFA15
MSSPLWRVAHFYLAVISSIFLFIASITGAILSFEPIYQKGHDFYVENADDLSVRDIIENISEKHEEILNIKRDKNGFISIQTIDQETPFIVDPYTGKKLGDLIETPEIFEFSRTLHRSLFLGQTGRFLIGITSVILLFIAISGFFLILKKQGGLKNYFTKVIKNDFYKDYHTRFSRWLILSILLLSLTGTYLFLERFNLVLVPQLNHSVDILEDFKGVKQPISSFEIFNKESVGNLREINFPFAEFPDEFFELKLKNSELLIDQFTGEVMSEIRYPITQIISQVSFNLHTGEGTILWALILFITSIGILFFIYSGFAIYLKRDKTKITNPFKKEECSIIMLVGSEQGSTIRFANALHKGLLKKGLKVYQGTMDEYKVFESMEHLLVLTSTYGLGEAPANANKFINKLSAVKQNKPFKYAVLGFGSSAYPDFCQFAIDSDLALKQTPKASQAIPLHTVDNELIKAFLDWTISVGALFGKQLVIDEKLLVKTKSKRHKLKVSNLINSPNSSDKTFLLKLNASKRNLNNLESGDLLSITPPNETKDRLYSMSIDKGNSSICLSIRQHDKGACSTYLSQLLSGEKIPVSFKKNPSFHFPKEAPGVILIANGTGIAPFLGMINESALNQDTSLYWGGQNKASYQLYESELDEAIQSGKLNRLVTAYSREGKKQYVQDVISTDLEYIVNKLHAGFSIMICGGLKMQQEVEGVLNNYLEAKAHPSLTEFKSNGQILTDCY